MKTKKLLAVIIASTLCIIDFKEPATANPIAAPACKDVPSCVVTGFVVIGGVGYYIIKNTVTGLTRRVPANQSPPAHRNIHAGEEAEGWMLNGLVDNKEQCVRKALIKSETTGRTWTSKIKPAGITSPSGRPQLYCYLKEVEG